MSSFGMTKCVFHISSYHTSPVYVLHGTINLLIHLLPELRMPAHRFNVRDVEVKDIAGYFLSGLVKPRTSTHRLTDLDFLFSAAAVYHRLHCLSVITCTDAAD